MDEDEEDDDEELENPDTSDTTEPVKECTDEYEEHINKKLKLDHT